MRSYSVDLRFIRLNLDLTWLDRIPAWGWLALMAALVRLVNLGQESLWYDEAFTAWLAKLDFGHMMRAVLGDIHPPGWYIVEWVTLHILGGSEIALRLPAALLGIAIVLMVYRLAILLNLGQRVAIASGLLACFLPGAIYYSQDARMYDMLAFGVLWMAISALKDNWSYFAVAGVITVYSQNLGLLYVGAIWFFVMMPRFRDWLYHVHMRKLQLDGGLDLHFQRFLLKESLEALGSPILAGLAIFLAWLPWLPAFLGMARAVKAGFWLLPLNAGSVLMPFFEVPMGWRLPDVLQLHAYIVALGMTAVGLIICYKWLFTRQGFIMLSIVVGMPALTAVASIFWRSVYLPRAMLPSIFGLMVIWAYAIVQTSRANRTAILLCLIPALVAGDIAHYFPQTPRFPVKEWVQPMKDNWRDGDIVYSLANDGYIMVGYYMAGYPMAIMPETTDLNQSLSHDTQVAMGFNQIPFERLKAVGYKRAWITASENGLSSRMELDGLAMILATHHWALIRHYDDKHSLINTYLIDL